METERCTKQRAQIVEMNVMFLSNQQKADLFIAEIAIKSIENQALAAEEAAETAAEEDDSKV